MDHTSYNLREQEFSTRYKVDYYCFDVHKCSLRMRYIETVK